MNRLSNCANITQTARQDKRPAVKPGKAQRNPFLNCSDETIDEFFLMLNKLPSPLKEEVFVKFCLTGEMKDNFFH